MTIPTPTKAEFRSWLEAVPIGHTFINRDGAICPLHEFFYAMYNLNTFVHRSHIETLIEVDDDGDIETTEQREAQPWETCFVTAIDDIGRDLDHATVYPTECLAALDTCQE